MIYIKEPSVSATILRAFQHIDMSGVDIPTRNGAARTVYNAFMETTNPRLRHLALKGRKSNIFQLIAESLWVLSGSGRVTGFLEFFLPRALNYSDDGQTWRGAYGPRLMDTCQLDDVVEAFEQDGLHTRRAIAAIYNPSLDSKAGMQATYGFNQTKDLPCNLLLNFYVQGNRFCCKLIQRSGDALFGAGSINPFEFTLIQELVYSKVRETYPDLELGSFVHDVTNLHVYDAFYSQVGEVLGQRQPAIDADPKRVQEAWIKNTFDDFKDALAVWINAAEDYIAQPNADTYSELVLVATQELLNEVGHKLGSANIVTDYIFIVNQFLITKLGAGEADHTGELYLSAQAPDDLLLALRDSKFSPFKAVYRLGDDNA